MPHQKDNMLANNRRIDQETRRQTDQPTGRLVRGTRSNRVFHRVPPFLRLHVILIVFCLLTIDSLSQAGVNTSIIPSDRSTVWNPGLNAVGGIPNRTTIYKTLAPSGGDDTTAIQNALDTCPANQVVKLGPGTFNLSGNGLSITQSSITLRGSGPTLTKLLKVPGTNYPDIIIGTRWYKYVQPVNLAVDASAGAISVTLASNPGYQVGEIVTIDQLTNPTLTQWSATSPLGDPSRGWFGETNRPIGQVVEIKGISGNTLQFTTPLHTAFLTAYGAHIVRFSSDGSTMQPAVEYSGIEDLYVDYGEGGDGGGNIHLFAAAYSWVKDVESDKSNGTSVNIDGSFRCVLRDSYVHSTVNPTPGGAGYGIGINDYAADNLVENNVSWNFNKVDVMRTSGGGNVFGYNYMEDGWGATYPTEPEIGLNASHMTTPHYEMFEGNEVFNLGADARWGNAIYITVFRNHFTGLRRALPPLNTYTYAGSCTLYYEDIQNRLAVQIEAGHWWYTVIGNVMGFSGESIIPKKTTCIGQATGGFEYEEFSPFNDNYVPMWVLGTPDPVGTPNITVDPQVAATLIRGGNYDFATNSTHWENLSQQAIPPSLYLASVPPFFGSVPWPPIGPDVSGYVNTIPARVCFDQGLMPNCLASGTPPPPSSCDVNGDGVVNVVDVQLEVNMALGISSCTNSDGQCTVVQVQRVVNSALGGTCVSP